MNGTKKGNQCEGWFCLQDVHGDVQRNGVWSSFGCFLDYVGRRVGDKWKFGDESRPLHGTTMGCEFKFVGRMGR